MDTMDRIEQMLQNAFADAERARKELDVAHAAGKEIVQVLCDEDTKRGDIIEIQKYGDDISEKETEESLKKVKVITLHDMSAINPDTNEMHIVCYAWGIVLEEGDIITKEDFAALYAGDEEDTEALDSVEIEDDPDICLCGADRALCARSQSVFGSHINE